MSSNNKLHWIASDRFHRELHENWAKCYRQEHTLAKIMEVLIGEKWGMLTVHEGSTPEDLQGMLEREKQQFFLLENVEGHHLPPQEWIQITPFARMERKLWIGQTKIQPDLEDDVIVVDSAPTTATTATSATSATTATTATPATPATSATPAGPATPATTVFTTDAATPSTTEATATLEVATPSADAAVTTNTATTVSTTIAASSANAASSSRATTPQLRADLVVETVTTSTKRMVNEDNRYPLDLVVSQPILWGTLNPSITMEKQYIFFQVLDALLYMRHALVLWDREDAVYLQHRIIISYSPLKKSFIR